MVRIAHTPVAATLVLLAALGSRSSAAGQDRLTILMTEGWFGSGTIGAARAAAFLGLPALAVSGLDSDEPDQVEALADWIARTAQSEVVLEMEPDVHFTIGVPRIPPGEIQGVRVAPRARILTSFSVSRLATMNSEEDDEPVSIWSVEANMSASQAAEHEDVALYSDGWIVVTPMTVDEQVDGVAIDTGSLESRIPPWRR